MFESRARRLAVTIGGLSLAVAPLVAAHAVGRPAAGAAKPAGVAPAGGGKPAGGVPAAAGGKPAGGVPVAGGVVAPTKIVLRLAPVVTCLPAPSTAACNENPTGAGAPLGASSVVTTVGGVSRFVVNGIDPIRFPVGACTVTLTLGSTISPPTVGLLPPGVAKPGAAPPPNVNKVDWRTAPAIQPGDRATADIVCLSPHHETHWAG